MMNCALHNMSPWRARKGESVLMSENRHLIWSNRDLDIEDGWREAYAECAEINGWDVDLEDEDAIREYMYETNDSYLGDERMNLDIEMSQPIIAIADLGLWHGRVMGYKEVGSNNIRDCLKTMNDYDEFYVDAQGDLRQDSVHHDGTNHILYRAYRDDVTEEQIEDFLDKIYEGKADWSDIEAMTVRLGDEIGKVYGWEFEKPLDVKMAEAAEKSSHGMCGTQVERGIEGYKDIGI